MKAEDLLKSYGIHHWAKYKPDIPQYMKFAKDQANLILAGHKIQDIDVQFSNARASLIYLEVDDYGQLITENDSLHQTFVRSKFLFDALALYNYCIDLSWQVVYLYHGDAHFGVIQDDKYYLQATKDCDMTSLQGRLVKVNKRDGLFKHIDDFFNEPLTEEVREAYNYIKHRGTYYIEGLGLNESVLPIGLPGDVEMKMLKRRTMDLEEWKEKLIKFDLSFIKYFEAIIKALMPEDFTDNSVGLNTVLETAISFEDWGNQKKDK
ncbi:hypothetical protein [Priestia megaterium]|uniref:hypothetical protein n=1 Tax=Priestia megaterium TaxID=1404 RepID=UPI00372D4D90